MITRELDAVYADALRALALDPVAMPVTRCVPPDDPAALPAALSRGEHAAPLAAIVVASARAADALIAARGDLPLPEVWAVGPATARALSAAGIAAHVPPVAKDGATLAHALIAARPLAGRRVLVPRAEDGRDDAIDALRAAGAEVEAVVAYRTVAVAADDPAIARGLELLARGEAAVCAVFAPSQAAALDAVIPLAKVATRFVAIGETTARSLRDRGVVCIAADQPTPEGLARAVRAVYSVPS